MSSKNKRPQIFVRTDEHERLVDLALAAMERTPGAADLFVELSRAKGGAIAPRRDRHR